MTTDNCYGVVPTSKISCRSARVNMLELWHQRFGQANFKQVAKVSKLEAVEGLPKFGNVEKKDLSLFVRRMGSKRNFQPLKLLNKMGWLRGKLGDSRDGKSYVTKQANSLKVLGRSREHLMSHW